MAVVPRQGYFITGSWDDWNQGIAMMEEATGDVGRGRGQRLGLGLSWFVRLLRRSNIGRMT